MLPSILNLFSHSKQGLYLLMQVLTNTMVLGKNECLWSCSFVQRNWTKRISECKQVTQGSGKVNFVSEK
ncbi:hypothetical protein XENTR_v10000764 [Xenopus tropicalis]|nr:hypothetical protein XENTR_v10000764 [Xenopus tropicalis]